MGLILDLIADAPAILWSFTTEASLVDFYLQPDYILRPHDWVVDFGVRASDTPVPDGTIESIPAYATAHPYHNRDGTIGYGDSYEAVIDGTGFWVSELVERDYENLDTVPYSITASTQLDTRGFLDFSEINLVLFNQRYNIDHDYTVTIDWGDGTQTVDSPITAPTNPTDLIDWTYPHSYDQPGLYTITVTTTAAEATPGDGVDTLILYWQIVPGATAFTYGCTIDWGDGTEDTYSATATGNPDVDDYQVAVAHAYEDPGPHTVSFTATEGRWTLYFGAGGQEDITELGPMACGFRLAADLYYTFNNIGINHPGGTTIDPGFRLDNAVFMHYTFEDGNINALSTGFPFASELPAFSLKSLRGGYGAFDYTVDYPPLDMVKSLYRCNIFRAYEDGFYFIADPEILYGMLSLDDYDWAPRGAYDDLLIYLEASSCERGILDTYSQINSVAAYEANQALVSRGWVVDDPPDYLFLGFFVFSDRIGGLRHTLPTYHQGFWLEPAAGGYDIKFTIHRTPWLNPTAPQAATVDWALTKTTSTRTYTPTPYGGFYPWVAGTPVQIATGTATFTANQTTALITANYVGTLNPFSNYTADTKDSLTLTLFNESGELLGDSVITEHLTLGGAGGVVSEGAQVGFWLTPFSQTPITGGIEIVFKVFRSPLLNPASPGVASVQWSFKKKQVTDGSLYAPQGAWTDIATETLSFAAGENTKYVTTQYIGAYTTWTSVINPFTAFRVQLHTPVNETLGTSCYDFFLY